MPEYLELNLDKFIFRVANDRLYSREGVWVLPEATPGSLRVRVGLTDFLQQRSGDAAFVYPQAVGVQLKAGDALAEVETIKANLDLISPVAGEIVEINALLETAPETVNQEPYGQGWVAVIRTADWETDRAALLDPRAYLACMGEQAKENL